MDFTSTRLHHRPHSLDWVVERATRPAPRDLEPARPLALHEIAPSRPLVRWSRAISILMPRHQWHGTRIAEWGGRVPKLTKYFSRRSISRYTALLTPDSDASRWASRYPDFQILVGEESDFPHHRQGPYDWLIRTNAMAGVGVPLPALRDLLTPRHGLFLTATWTAPERWVEFCAAYRRAGLRIVDRTSTGNLGWFILSRRR